MIDTMYEGQEQPTIDRLQGEMTMVPPLPVGRKKSGPEAKALSSPNVPSVPLMGQMAVQLSLQQVFPTPLYNCYTPCTVRRNVQIIIVNSNIYLYSHQEMQINRQKERARTN